MKQETIVGSFALALLFGVVLLIVVVDRFGSASTGDRSATTVSSTVSGGSPTSVGSTKVLVTTAPSMNSPTGSAASGGSPKTTSNTRPRSNTTTGSPTSDGSPKVTVTTVSPKTTTGGSPTTTVAPNSGGTSITGGSPTSSGSPTTTVAASTGVSLGSASPYSVIAGAAFTRGASNTISGSTLWSVAGESSGPWRDASNAYSNASGRTSTNTTGATDFQTNLPLTAGVYRHTAYVSATDTLTLDAQGNSNAVFIFQISGYLSTEAGFRVVLINGARADNVFWKVGSYFAPGASTIFKGTVVAGTYITTGAGLDIDGRLFALSGAVTTGASNIIR